MPSRPRKPSINITPLIDVMFLLLIFFMVSSTFRDYPAIDIALPKSAAADTQSTDGHELVITKNGDYYLAGQPISVDALPEKLDALYQADREAALILKADKGVSFQQVVTVIDLTKRIGWDRLVIPTDPLESDSDLRQQ